MTLAQPIPDLTNLKSEIEALYTNLSKPEFRQLPLDDRIALLKSDNYDEDLQKLHTKLETVWRQRLDEVREAKADFDEVLLALLPLAHKLSEVEKLLAGHYEQSLPERTGTVEDGLTELISGQWDKALHLLASAGKAEVVSATLRDQRMAKAEQLLQAVPDSYALHNPPDKQGQIYKSLKSVLLIGSAAQREEAQRFLSPQRPGKRPRIVMIISILILVVLASAFTIRALLSESSSASPTSTTLLAPSSSSDAITMAVSTQDTTAFTVTTADPATPDGTTIAISTTAPTSAPTTATLKPTSTSVEITPTVIATVTPTEMLTLTPTNTPTAALEVRTVRGVEEEYIYTGRVATDSFGPFTKMRTEPQVNSSRVSVLRNGDQVGLLRSDVEGWYQVRILANGDGSQVGQEGWIERWLVNDEAVPTPRPTAIATRRPTPIQARTFSAVVVRSYPGTGQSGQQESCIQGRVVDLSGNGIAAVVLYANNGVSNSATKQTNSQGEYNICGLGDSNWSIVLTSVPGSRPLARQAFATVYVNGSPYQIAVVNFSER